MSSKNQNTRGRILDACWKLLEAGDAKAVRMSDIAKTAGISRQALYLHFPTRAELLIATTRHLDEVYKVEASFGPDFDAAKGMARVDMFIDAWGAYIPKIYGVAKALLAMKDTDAEAAAAWDDRMQAVRGLCRSSVAALEKAGALSLEISSDHAVDLLWTLMSVRNWEHLTQECGWSNETYIAQMKRTARKVIAA